MYSSQRTARRSVAREAKVLGRTTTTLPDLAVVTAEMNVSSAAKRKLLLDAERWRESHRDR